MRLSAVALILMLAACRSGPQSAAVFTSGDPGHGQAVIQYYGCGSCHSIGGIDTARGQVGPPLNGVRDRVYIAGMLQNDPDNMSRWIRDPKAVNPRTDRKSTRLNSSHMSISYAVFCL